MTRPGPFANPQDGAARFYKAFYRWSKHTRTSIHQDRPRRYVQPATSHNHIIHRPPGAWKQESFSRCSSGTRTVRRHASSAAAEVAQPQRRTETVWVDALFDRITVHQKDGIQEESLCTIYEGGADEHPDGRTDQKPILLWGTEDSIARAKELVETALGELRVREQVYHGSGHSNLGEGQDNYQSPLHLAKHDTDALPNDVLDSAQARDQAHGISSHPSYQGRQPLPEESIAFSPFDQWHASQPSEEAQGIESTKDFVPRFSRDSGRGGGNRIDSPAWSRPSGKKGNLQSPTNEASSHENTAPKYEEITIFIPRKAWKSIRGEDDRFLDRLKEEYNIASFDIEDNDSTSRLRVRGTKRAIDSVSEIIERKIEMIAEGVQKVDADVFMRKAGAQPDRTDRFKTAMRCMPHPVTLITTSDNPGNVPAVPFSHLKKKLIQRDPTKLSQIQRLRAISDTDRGVTVNSLTAVTVDPPALTFNIKTPSRTLDAMRSNGFINVHILANNSIGAAIADAFTKPHDQPAESFLRLMATQPRVSFGRMTHGELALNGPGVIAVLRCKLLQSHSMTVGDHVVLLAEVMTVFFTTQRDAVSDPSSGDENVSLAYAHRKFRRHGGAIEFRSTDQVDKWFSKGLGVQKKPQAEEAAAVEPLVEESAVEDLKPTWETAADRIRKTLMADDSETTIDTSSNAETSRTAHHIADQIHSPDSKLPTSSPSLQPATSRLRPSTFSNARPTIATSKAFHTTAIRARFGIDNDWYDHAPEDTRWHSTRRKLSPLDTACLDPAHPERAHLRPETRTYLFHDVDEELQGTAKRIDPSSPDFLKQTVGEYIAVFAEPDSYLMNVDTRYCLARLADQTPKRLKDAMEYDYTIEEGEEGWDEELKDINWLLRRIRYLSEGRMHDETRDMISDILGPARELARQGMEGTRRARDESKYQEGTGVEPGTMEQREFTEDFMDEPTDDEIKQEERLMKEMVEDSLNPVGEQERRMRHEDDDEDGVDGYPIK